MKMLLGLFLSTMALGVLGSTGIGKHASGAIARECFHVVDECGSPVADARVIGGFQIGDGMDDYVAIDGLTDAKGEYVAEGFVKRTLHYQISREGYYDVEDRIVYGEGKERPSYEDGKWRPFGDIRTITMKRIKRLGSLSVLKGKGSRVGRWTIPARERWIGFDLEAFDWTAPYGSGLNDDVLLFFRSSVRNEYFDFRFSMDVCFTNNPLAGAYICKKDTGSCLEWSENADADRQYLKCFSFVFERKPDGARVVDTLDEDSYMVFRTRTKTDEYGNLVSAHYGVISGEWLLGSESMRIGDACFNGNVNDLCIEDGYYLRKKVKERNELRWMMDAKNKGCRQ